jgi:hypothetical protein
MKYFIFKFYFSLARFVTRIPRNITQVIARTFVSQITQNKDETEKSFLAHMIFLKNREDIKNYHANQNKLINQKYEGLHTLKKEHRNKGDFTSTDIFVVNIHFLQNFLLISFIFHKKIF